MMSIGLLMSAAALSLSLQGGGPLSQCVTCHVARMADGLAGPHVTEWQASAHGRARIGCDRCHGGDPVVVTPSDAHRGVVNSHVAGSQVSGAKLPGTCGACHRAAADAFRNSRHFERLSSGDARVPTCSTCHGAMAVRVPSPEGLERRCAECHRSGRSLKYPGEARALLEEATRIRAALREADAVVTTVRDAGRRGSVQALQMRAQAAMLDLTEALHAFDLARAGARVRAARTRVDELRARLRMPSGSEPEGQGRGTS